MKLNKKQDSNKKFELQEIYKILTNQEGINKNLEKTLNSHINKSYQKPISDLQINIFEKINNFIKLNPKPIILDSGCGTAMSTEILASQNPDHWVIGIDRSIDRLQKSRLARNPKTNEKLYIKEKYSLLFKSSKNWAKKINNET